MSGLADKCCSITYVEGSNNVSKILTEGARMALALNRDAFGNFISNQDERSIRYLALQNELLLALVACAEDRNDPRRTRTLERLIKEIGGDKHEAYDAFPEFDRKKQADSARHVQFGDLAAKVLTSTPHAALPDAVRAQLEKAFAEGHDEVRIEMPAQDMRDILEPQRH